MPIAQTNPPTPGTLNNGLINGLSRTPIKRTTPKPISISETMKNGSREGKTISHHIFKPLIDASKDSCGKDMREAAIKVTEAARNSVFNLDLNTFHPPFSGL